MLCIEPYLNYFFRSVNSFLGAGGLTEAISLRFIVLLKSDQRLSRNTTTAGFTRFISPRRLPTVFFAIH